MEFKLNFKYAFSGNNLKLILIEKEGTGLLKLKIFFVDQWKYQKFIAGIREGISLSGLIPIINQ